MSLFFYISSCLPFYRFFAGRASLWQLRILGNIWLYGRGWRNVSGVTWVSVSSRNKKGTEFFAAYRKWAGELAALQNWFAHAMKEMMAMADIIFKLSFVPSACPSLLFCTIILPHINNSFHLVVFVTCFALFQRALHIISRYIKGINGAFVCHI